MNKDKMATAIRPRFAKKHFGSTFRKRLESMISNQPVLVQIGQQQGKSRVNGGWTAIAARA